MALMNGNLVKSPDSTERVDLVAYWSVPLADGAHTVEFEHGTTSGKRVIRVDGKEILRREWMFKLVGDEYFTIGKQRVKCELRVDPMPHFSFSYSLFVDGKPLEKFTQKALQSMRSWYIVISGKRYRIVFEKQTLNIWINGQIVEAENIFVDNGTEMKFKLEEADSEPNAVIKSTAGEKKNGILQSLYINGQKIDEDVYI